MAQVRLKGSGVKSFDSDDFDNAQQVDYIAKDITATDPEEEPIIGTLQFTGNAVESQVASGLTFYNNDVYTKKTGTLSFNSASGTTEADVEQGKIVYTNSLYTPITGSLSFQGNARASEVEKGLTYYDTDLHTKRTGTLEFKEYNTSASDVESGKTFYNDNLRTRKTGTLKFTGTATDDVVEKGYTYYNTDLHNVRTGTLDWSSASTSGTAVAANILSGKTAYINNLRTKVSGTMKNNGAVSKVLNSGESYTIPEGYHTGSGKITENSPKDQTSISTSGAGAAQVWTGKTVYVNGNIITGTGNVVNTNNATGEGGPGSSARTGKVTIYWTYPTSGWYTGVCILGQAGVTAPTSNTPHTADTRVYMGKGTMIKAGSYYATIDNLRLNALYSFNVYPYVIVDDTTYWYGSPAPIPRSVLSIRTGCNSYSTCNCNNKDCDGSCGCDGQCCQACSF